eukprot:6485434-Amphidinium_carterae.1
MALGRAMPVEVAASSMEAWSAARSPWCSSGCVAVGGAEALRRVLWVVSTTVSSRAPLSLSLGKEDAPACAAEA